MELGLADGIAPPAPLTGNAYAQTLPQIPANWDAAITRFAASKLMPRLFPLRLIDNFTRTKRQEIAALGGADPQELLTLYLDSL
jgi:glutamine synthetase